MKMKTVQPCVQLACFLALLSIGVGCAVLRPGVTLADQTRSSYRIVIAAHAIKSERYAAEELQGYLERIGGARIPIVTDAEKAQPREILLGDNAHLRELGAKVDFAKLGPDGFVLRTDGKCLIVAGGKPRGTLNGVYTLLEEELGVRWFTPEVEKVPRMNRVALRNLNETVVPALEVREVSWREIMRNADFAAKNRVNGQHYGLEEKHGGPVTVFYPWVHSFDELIPKDLFREHPEYFPLIEGKREDGYTQRCLTNPEVLSLAVEQVRRWIKKHPEANVISVSQNDGNDNNCRCEKCKAADDAEGAPMGSLLQFVNAVAEVVGKEHPNIRIDTLAYQYTRKPPKTIRPRNNVIVRLCSIECCFAHPVETCSSKGNAAFQDDITAWQPVAPYLYVWDYTTNFGNYLMPFPNFDSLQSNVQFFVKHGVKGIHEEGNYSEGGNGEMGPLRAYVLAKLVWNPNTDVKRHIQEFTDGYFGRAAPAIREYLELEHRQVRAQTVHARIFDNPSAPYLTDTFVAAAENLFDDAEAAAENEEVRFRVQVARLPIWYLELARNRVEGDARMELAQRFVAVARKAGVTNISEGQLLKDWAKSMGVE